MKLCAFFVPLLRNDRSRSRRECVARRPIIVPIRLAGAPGMVAATGALPVIALAVMEFGPAFGVKTSPMEKRPHAKSFLHSSSTMANRLGHIAKIFSIPISTTPAPPPGRIHGMAVFARLILPTATSSGPSEAPKHFAVATGIKSQLAAGAAAIQL